MSLTIANLCDVGVSPTQARIYADPLAAAMASAKITTVDQRAAFLAQALHESAMLAHMEELLSYRSIDAIKGAFGRLRAWPDAQLAPLVRDAKALAEAAYGNRNGNRPGSGDGWAFRGSGPFQLTGRNNFQRAQDETGNPYVERPDLVRKVPEHGCLVAGLFWTWNAINSVIDEGDFLGVSKLVNLGDRYSRGIPNGNGHRNQLFADLRQILT